MKAGLVLAASGPGTEPASFLDSPFLALLNSSQCEAVAATQGPLLVLAGAGTGKTRVLTTRIAHILQQGLAANHQVLAVTFTNKAANEMRNRIISLLGHPVDGMWVGTFHSLAVRILRVYAEHVGLKSNFTILDTDDQLRVIKQLMKVREIEDNLTPKIVMYKINKFKDKGVTAAKATHYDDPIISLLYNDYQERLRTLNAVDFGDLLLHNLTLFQEHSHILQHYQNLFRYILVDEYQDTNTAQYIWIRLLAAGSNNICCVGDDDQSIYGWRGAEVGNILRFEKDYPGAKVIRLEQNYRSTSPILRAASGLIEHNKGRYGKTLWTEQKEGELIQVKACSDGDYEARSIANDIEALQRSNHALNEMAILVRATYQTRTFEECFMKMGIPYRVIGGLRFYERQEIRDCIAYFRIVIQEDDSLAFERIINLPKRGIGDTSLQRIHQFAREQGISVPKAAKFIIDNPHVDIKIPPKARTALSLFFKDLERWRAWLTKEPHDELAKIILDESGYTQVWTAEKSPDSAARLENIKELVLALKQFESLAEFLEHISLVLDTNSVVEDDMVSIMTLHAAKGLEFETVFLAGWEEGLLPHPKSLYEEGGTGVEEERRLAYVGISRAKKRAIITFAYSRRTAQGSYQAAQPSRFISEIPTDVVQYYNHYGSPITMPSVALNENAHQQGSGFSSYRRSDANPYLSQQQWSPKHDRSKSQDSLTQFTTHSFKTGDTVQHDSFGIGQVIAFEGDKLIIQFSEFGLKKIMADFVQRA